jgi:hypothetical protein
MVAQVVVVVVVELHHRIPIMAVVVLVVELEYWAKELLVLVVRAQPPHKAVLGGKALPGIMGMVVE